MSKTTVIRHCDNNHIFNFSTKQPARHFSFFFTQLPKAVPLSIFVLLQGFMLMKGKTLQLNIDNTFLERGREKFQYFSPVGPFSGTFCDVRLPERSVAVIRMCCHHWTRCSHTTVAASLVCQPISPSVRLSPSIPPL